MISLSTWRICSSPGSSNAGVWTPGRAAVNGRQGRTSCRRADQGDGLQLRHETRNGAEVDLLQLSGQWEWLRQWNPTSSLFDGQCARELGEGKRIATCRGDQRIAHCRSRPSPHCSSRSAMASSRGTLPDPVHALQLLAGRVLRRVEWKPAARLVPSPGDAQGSARPPTTVRRPIARHRRCRRCAAHAGGR